MQVYQNIKTSNHRLKAMHAASCYEMHELYLLSGGSRMLELAFLSRTSRDTKNPRARYEAQLLILHIKAPLMAQNSDLYMHSDFLQFSTHMSSRKIRDWEKSISIENHLRIPAWGHFVWKYFWNLFLALFESDNIGKSMKFESSSEKFFRHFRWLLHCFPDDYDLYKWRYIMLISYGDIV